MLSSHFTCGKVDRASCSRLKHVETSVARRTDFGETSRFLNQNFNIARGADFVPLFAVGCPDAQSEVSCRSAVL